MLEPDEVMSMVRLHKSGWGAKRIAKEFQCARNTVRRYLREGGTVAYKGRPRVSALDGLDNWLRERFFRHEGNADVIRSCPTAWCSFGSRRAFRTEPGMDQLAAGRLMRGSSLIVAMVSSVM